MDQNQNTFYFHDYESFGINPALDRPSQFAGIRTDSEFNIIDDPLLIYCKLPQDYLPDPQAVLITGITPQEANQKGMIEPEFTEQIHHAFSQSNTCILGYNNIRFDDEVTRNILYRNFYDPYAYSYQNANSRWDLLDVMRACYALRPEGINWPTTEEGVASFRLEHLTTANHIQHDNAHDAMSDVYATIAMAKLVKQKQSKLFNYFYQLRDKNKLSELIDVMNMTPILHVSGMLGGYRKNTSIFSPITWHPKQSNSVIMCDLTGNIDLLLNLSVEQLHENLYCKKDDLQDSNDRPPLKLIHTNKCPIVAPLKVLLPENAKRLNIDVNQCLINHRKLLENQLVLQEKMTQLFSIQTQFPQNDDVDSQIYNGFLKQHDKLLCQTIRSTPPHLLNNLNLTFEDPRLDTLFFRYKARNFPSNLSVSEQVKWHDYCHEKLNANKIRDYVYNLENLAQDYMHEPEKLLLIKSLYHYCYHLVG